MDLTRRGFLAGVAAAALTLSVPTKAQVYVKPLNGRPVVSALGLPIQPAIVGTSLFNQQITLNNPAGQPTQTNPFITFGIPIARSEFPASGYKLALYDSTGTTKVMDLQVDMQALGWALDGSCNYCVVCGYATGSTIAAGSTLTVTIKAIAGTSPTTPVCTLTTLKANSNIFATSVIQPDTYNVLVNNIITNYGGFSTSYPQYYIRQWKSGPYACEWCFGQYLQRVSDGLFHRWVFLKLYVTALSASGPFIVRGYLENAQSYGANPLGGIGSTANTYSQTVIDSTDIYNGATHIGSIGGPLDQNTTTFLPTAVDLAHGGEINVTFSSGLATSGNLNTYRNAVGFKPSAGGTLPAGLTTTDTYWLMFDGATQQLMLLSNRLYVTYIYGGGWAKIATISSGLSVPLNRWIYANGGIYHSTVAGISTGTLPTGATFADNANGGSLVWARASTTQITSQGTGTHTMFFKAAVWAGSKVPIVGTDTYPFWNGAGALPKLLVGYNRNYVVQKAKAVLPLDPAITTLSPWSGALPHYVQNMTYLPGSPNIYDIGDGGEATMDERININGPTALASMCLPNDEGMFKSVRLIALSWVDRNACFRDERSQEIPVCNFGPNRLGANYPNMPPTNSGLHLGVAGTGSPATIGIQTDAADWPGYGGSYTTGGTPDVAHCPNAAYWPALVSGDPMFFDSMIEYANQAYSQQGSGQQVRTALFNGVNMSWAWCFFQQIRSAAHELQIFSQTSWIIPNAHPAWQYFSDIMDDSSQIGPLWINAHVGTNGQSVGYYPFNPPSPPPRAANPQMQEPWMLGYLIMVFLQEAIKGNRPGFGSFASTYLYKGYLPLFDSDVGGSEQFVDLQWSCIGTGTALPPADADFLTTVPLRLQGSPLLFKAFATIPPPTALFINGINSAQSSTTYVYRTPGLNSQAFPGNAYGLTARAVCQMGQMLGYSYFTKIASRIETFIAANYNGNPCTWNGQGPTSGQPFTSAGNNNGLMYAMKAQ